jgi:hypothetical protein
MWQQVYDPFGNSVFSTVAAAISVVTLLLLIATGAVRTHLAALIALLRRIGHAAGLRLHRHDRALTDVAQLTIDVPPVM